jgi:hypothetical protein
MSSGGQKLRRPLEFMVAFMRTAHIEVIENYWLILGALEQLGQQPFAWKAPNGYPDVASAWLNANAMLMRWKVAFSLTVIAPGWVEGLRTHLAEQIGTPETADALVDTLTATLLPAVTLDPQDRQTLIEHIAVDRLSAQARTNLLPAIAALLISSPYFQWC